MDKITRKLTVKGSSYQTVIPKKILDALNLEIGDDIEFILYDDNTVCLKNPATYDSDNHMEINELIKEMIAITLLSEEISNDEKAILKYILIHLKNNLDNNLTGSKLAEIFDFISTMESPTLQKSLLDNLNKITSYFDKINNGSYMRPMLKNIGEIINHPSFECDDIEDFFIDTLKILINEIILNEYYCIYKRVYILKMILNALNKNKYSDLELFEKLKAAIETAISLSGIVLYI